MFLPGNLDLCTWAHALDLFEVKEEIEDLKANTQAEGSEAEGGHQEEDGI